jgi:hypothetical protein
MTSDTQRHEALRNLIELSPSVPEALERLTPFPWPGEEPGVTLTLHDLRRVLDSFDARILGESDLETWAEEVHGREDIELDPADRDLLADALFELSTPELFGAMPDIVSGLRRRMT